MENATSIWAIVAAFGYPLLPCSIRLSYLLTLSVLGEGYLVRVTWWGLLSEGYLVRVIPVKHLCT